MIAVSNNWRGCNPFGIFSHNSNRAPEELRAVQGICGKVGSGEAISELWSTNESRNKTDKNDAASATSINLLLRVEQLRTTMKHY